jgi:hypothetical protein
MVALGPVLFVLIVLKNTPEVLFVPLVITAAGSFIAFMTVTVKVDSQNVVIAFCDFFKRTVPRDEIATVTTDNAAGPSGYGFRYMGPGIVEYLVGGRDQHRDEKRQDGYCQHGRPCAPYRCPHPACRTGLGSAF